MIARSRERGARSGRLRYAHALPFTTPKRNGVATQATFPADLAPLPEIGTEADVPPTQPTSTAEAPSRSGKPKKRFKLPRRARLAATVVVAACVVGAGFAGGGFGGAGSPEPTVGAFLLAWQQANYDSAARLTNGPESVVRQQLADAYTDLDASSESFTMQGVRQHGSTAIVTYTATVNLAESNQEWSYTGKFDMSTADGNWVVDWAPSVINPLLGPGDRLAVATSYTPRAPITDMNGQPLISMSTDYAIGVYPGKLKNASSTANSFAADVSPSAMELDPQQVLGQIQAAPPGDFLTLLTLSPSDFARLWPKLSKVNGISYTEQAQRLFSSPAQNIVGTVGTEDSPQLINEGAAYQPGMTIGLSGYEQTYQDTLTGTPTTTVEVVNSAGHVTHQWPVKGGQAGTPVQTTLNLTAQTAAANALAAQPSSAELVAVDTQTGAIRAEGTHTAGSVALPTDKGPLADEIAPGMAFSIVSTAALLSTGVTAKTPLPCEPVTSVGGETFTSSAQASSSATFASDFADACGTAFANLSRNLTAQQLATAEKDFGLGTTWQLQPTTAFSGSAPPLAGTNEGGVAEQATGSGGVLVSPLGMAIMAAEVATGVGHTPSLLVSDPPTKWDAPLTAADLGELQQLMRNSVANGAANAANLSGTPVYGQAGIVQTAKGKYLSWFVGYRGTLAVAAVETGTSPTQAAANLVAQFLKSATK